MNAAYTQALEALELVARVPEVRGGVFVLDQQDMAFVRKAVEVLRAALAATPREYPPLPEMRDLGDSGASNYGYDESDMRAYVDADRARQPQPSMGAPV